MSQRLAKRNPSWTREEHILAFNLYCKIPFGAIHIHNPRIILLAEILGRSIGAVSYKLANFSRLDPTLKLRGIKGMPHGAKGEQEVWDEFRSDPEALAFESERLLANRTGRSLVEVAEINEAELPREGKERDRVVRTRVNQQFFRHAVFAAYDCRCCVTGLQTSQLLVASHIIPWAVDHTNRVNPCNGLCLNALHDRAFDRGLMVIDSRFRLWFADSLKARLAEDHSDSLKWFLQFEGRTIFLPGKFRPGTEFLATHKNASTAKEAFSAEPIDKRC
jgi:putative restriction endonuclease